MTIALGVALLQGFVTFGDAQAGRDTLQAAPDAVVTAPAAGLEAGWGWAESTARDRSLDAYWIGWSVEGDTTGGTWHYYDRHVPLGGGRRGSASQMRISGFYGNMSFSGAKPGGLIGSTDPHEVVVLVRYERDGSRARLTRMHVGNAALPLRFGRGSLLWVGRSSDAASVNRLRTLYAEDPVFRRDVVSAVGAHRSAEAAVPALREWMASGDTVTIRREAAAWLGRHAHPDAVQALERALRDDSSATLRSQAARSLARVASADVAVTALVRAARTDPEQAVRRSAVQALGGVADDRAAAALAGLISDPGESAPTSVRREAVTQFGQRARSGPAPAATVELLQRISRNDSEAAVRLQAVESLLRLPDVATISFLVGLVNDHPDTRVQQRAVQAIARTEPSSDAAAALRRLAWEHSRLDVQRYATRALVQVGTDDARRLLADIAERHPHADVRRSALQAIVTLDTR